MTAVTAAEATGDVDPRNGGRTLPVATVVGQAAAAGVVALLAVLFWILYEFRRVEVFQPQEDAAMLYRYAVNLAAGRPLAWNAGEAPGLTDGATDLGFVLLLAPLIAAGLSAAAAGLVINGLGVMALGVVFGVANVLLWRLPMWLMLAVVALVASGPLYLYVVSGFSPAVLGAGLGAAFLLAMLARQRGTVGLAVAAGLVAGLLGWWRPEAFVLAPMSVWAAMLLAGRRPDGGMSPDGSGPTSPVPDHPAPESWVPDAPTADQRETRPNGPSRIVSWWPGIVAFVVVALGWVVFRLLYFGQLLPTSVVLKSDGLHLTNVVFSLQFLTALTLPVLAVVLVLALGRTTPTWIVVTALLFLSLTWIPLVASENRWQDHLPGAWKVAGVASLVVLLPLFGVAVARSRRGCARVWVPVALLGVSSVIWAFAATALNWWGRMQWPLVPVIVMACLTVVTGAVPITQIDACRARRLPATLRRHWLPAVCIAGLTFVTVGAGHTSLAVLWGKAPFSTAVAEALAAVDTSDVRLATTEAGLIPLAVTGPALDTYGHNNRAIAASGGTALLAELEALRPNVLAVHGATPNEVTDAACSGVELFGADWARQGTELYAYAASRNMELLRVTESAPCDAWSIFVAQDVPPQVRAALLGYQMRGQDLR